MFAYKDKTDKYGITHRNYFLTQGDTFSIVGTPAENYADSVATIKFKLAVGLEEFFSQDFAKQEDGRWLLTVDSVETTKWEVSEEPYTYEIEVYFIDDNSKTVAQADLTVWEQIKEA